MFPREVWPLLLETAVWLVLAALAWILSMEFAGKDMLFRWGAEFWPRAVATLMAALALIQFFVRYRNLTANGQEHAAESGVFEMPGLSHALKMGATFGVPLVYAFLLPRIGYYILTPFFIVSMMYLFGMRRLRHLIGTAAVIYLVFLLVFSTLLFVPLPSGYWPGFYEVNAAIIELLGF